MIEFEEFDGFLERGSGPDLTPLIDMVFLLLIFFLLTSFLTRPSVPVDLPRSETAGFGKTPLVSITIVKDGSLLLNGEPILKDNLLNSLIGIDDFQRSKEVIIQSDQDVRFGIIVEIMDISKKAGAENISFLVEKKR